MASPVYLTKIDVALDPSHKNANAASKDFYTLHYDLCGLALLLEAFQTQREREKREEGRCAPPPSSSSSG